MQEYSFSAIDSKEVAIKRLKAIIENLGYTIVDADETKPWGAYYRLANEEADRFVREFFPELDPLEARLGNPKLELSPKFLLVSPRHRLSWQYHDRRAERWCFLSDGAYYKSATDILGRQVVARRGEVIQFGEGERHRLCGADRAYTVVAEIWQHTDVEHPSDEDDIVRLEDDYKR